MYKTWLYLAIGCLGLIAGVPTPDMDERTLQDKYHIASNEEGLTGALQHQDPAVRSFAAMRLAYDEKKDAIRPIVDALAQEKIDGVKIIQATSAAQLGSAEGFNALKSMCEDRSWSPVMRMVAAQTMINFLSREDCLPDVLDALRSAPDDHQATFMALNLFTYKKFKHTPPGQIDEIRDIAAMYLKSEAPDLRMAAGMCIRDVGGPWAISELRAAIAEERDEAVRTSLARDIKDLISPGP
jgi:HEAT repeat protein